jgi:hypothetical protein
MRYCIFFTLSILLSIVCDTYGQWTKVMEDNRAVYWQFGFDKADELPTFGYMTVGNYPNDSNTIFQTTDGGFTWKEIPSTTDYPQAISICVKDRNTAWIFRNQPLWFEIYSMRTLDGGNTWDSLPIRQIFSGSNFNPNNNLLIANGTDYKTNIPYRSLSKDNGDSWTNVPLINESRYNIYFFDSLSGFETGIENGNSPYPTYINRTTDGGWTWTPSIKKYESCWSGVAIQNTKIGFICSRESKSILRTLDGGATWDTVHQFIDTSISGTIVGDLCHLYVQTSFSYREGINEDKYGLFESIDQGKTWSKVAHIGAQPYYGMYFQNNVLFVSYRGDQNTPVTPNALWRYQLPPNKPTIITDDIVLSGKQCELIDTILSIAAINQCDGEKVVLDTLFTTGSSAFKITHKGNGREIYWDTLGIQYTPSVASEDICQIHLRFRLKGNTFDTIITLTGKNILPRQEIELIPVIIANNLVAGKEADCNIYSSNTIQDRGLNKVTFDMTYDNDLLEVVSIAAQSGISATYTAPIVTNNIAQLPISISANNMIIDSLLPLITVKFRTYLTDTTISTLELSSIQLNNDDPDYKNCTLSATGNSTTFTQASVCGDSSIRAFMVTGKLIDILSIRPNPANEDVTIDFNSSIKGHATLQIIADIGDVSFEENLEVAQNQNSHEVSLSSLQRGTFFIRLQIGKDVVTGKFVKQ